MARRVEARVETESGLLERRMTGLPVARIQALSIDQAPLQRLLEERIKPALAELAAPMRVAR